MRYNLYVNQVKALEWGLNLAQSLVFSVLNEANSWASSTVFDGDVYYWFSKSKLIEELPMVTSKPDTIVRHLAALEKLGLIRRKIVVDGEKTYLYISITEKGKQWNVAPSHYNFDDSEGRKNIRTQEKKSDTPRKIIPDPSENYPTNTITSNPITNNPTKDLLSDSAELNVPAVVDDSVLFDANAKTDLLTQWFEWFWEQYQKKSGRKASLTSFQKIKLPNDRQEALDLLQRIVDQARDWGILYASAPADQKQYQPHPATWINNERWNDEEMPTIRQPQGFGGPQAPAIGHDNRQGVNAELNNIHNTDW
jgi:DNA-binding MarR family transcriptional regulator